MSLNTALLLNGLKDVASCAAVIWILRESKTNPRKVACERLLQLFTIDGEKDYSKTVTTLNYLLFHFFNTAFTHNLILRNPDDDSVTDDKNSISN